MSDTSFMTNRECAARLRDGGWLCCKDEASFAVALLRGAEALEAMPDSVTVAELIEGHDQLQLTLFEAVLRTIALDGTLARNSKRPRAEQDALAIARMMAMYAKTDHGAYRDRYNAAMLAFTAGKAAKP